MNIRICCTGVKMINIIIIEDSEDDYKYLADAIHRYAEQSGEVFSVKHYVSALLFLNEYKADADISRCRYNIYGYRTARYKWRACQ